MDVDPGSKPARDGVTRAFRFCVMESSIDDRDRRKKSRSVPVEKQNWGERRGNPGGCDIMGFGFLGPPTAPAVGAAPFHKMSASMWGVKEEKRIALESMIFWR